MSGLLVPLLAEGDTIQAPNLQWNEISGRSPCCWGC